MRHLEKRTSRIAIFALAALFAIGCSGGDSTPSDSDDQTAATTATSSTETNRRVIRVETAPVERQSFEEKIKLTGSLDAPNDAVISAQTAGTINRLVPLGRTVRQGYSVANLDATIANAALTQAKAQLEVAISARDLAEETYKRQAALYRDSIISYLEYEQVQTQYTQAGAGVSQAEALVAQAEKQVQFTRVVAPFTGTVEQHFADTGEQVAPGVPIARIVNTGRLNLKVGVPERFAGDVAVGSPVGISFASYDMDDIEARITFVGKVIDPTNRTFPIEVRVGNRDGKLKPEMVASAEILLKSFDDVLVIPQTSIIRDEEGESVFIVEGTGDNLTARRKVLSLGPVYDGRVVVEGGLEQGDRLITAGQNSVSTGDYVEPVTAATPSISSGATQ